MPVSLAYSPRLHLSHSRDPESAAMVPISHNLHSEAPKAFWKEPGAQGEHTRVFSNFTETLPGLHILQSTASDFDVTKLPCKSTRPFPTAQAVLSGTQASQVSLLDFTHSQAVCHVSLVSALTNWISNASMSLLLKMRFSAKPRARLAATSKPAATNLNRMFLAFMLR